MKKSLFIIFFLVFAAVLAAYPFLSFDRNVPIAQITNNGSKWRIGYLEGGSYYKYPESLKALVVALAELKWVEKFEFPLHLKTAETYDIWVWLSQNIESKYIKFEENAYWSNGWDHENQRQKTKAAINARLNKDRDIDLMLAMGTWAGRDLAENNLRVPTIVMASSDPVRFGIIESAENSGNQNIFARVAPRRYENQVKLFHDAIGFSKLGLVYDKASDKGSSFAPMDDVLKVAAERGFQTVTCNASTEGVSGQKAKQAALECYRRLSDKVDAIYITPHRGVTLRKLSKILRILAENQIPTFSQTGLQEVRHGVLMSVDDIGDPEIGMFYATNIAKIFNGAKPIDLNQIHEDPKRLAINMKMAESIGFEPSSRISSITSKIYRKIEALK